MVNNKLFVCVLLVAGLITAQQAPQAADSKKQWQAAVQIFKSNGNAPHILASAQKVVQQGYDARQVLNDAIINDVPSVVAWLLDTTKIATSTKFDDRDLLMQAAFARAPNVIELLLGRGFKINKKGPSDVSVLMYGALGGSPNVVKLLIKNGADITAKDNDGNFALRFALTGPTTLYDDVQGGENPRDTFMYLIQQLQAKQKEAFNINAENNDGWTLLMTAANQLMPQVVRELVTKYHARTDSKANGKTALDLAQMAIAAYTENLPRYKKEAAQETGETKKIYQHAIEHAQQKLKDGGQILKILGR